MASMMADSLVWMIVIPFLSGTIAFLSGKKAQFLIGIVSAVILTGVTVLTGMMVYFHGPARYQLGGWGSPLGIDLNLDGLSVIMLMLTAIVGLCVSIYASGYFSTDKKREEQHKTYSDKTGRVFWPLWLFTWGGLNALFLSSDIFNIYVCLEIMTFGAIALVAIAGSVASVSAALRYLLLSLFGSFLYLLGVGFLYSLYGTLDLAALGELLRPGGVSDLAFMLIVFGLLIKSALFPLHFWLPPAHANAPAPVSAVLSGVVIMAPFYLLVRFWFDVFNAVVNPAAGQILGVLGVVAICYGAFQAMRQARFKMVIAYSTVAQIGYMFLIFPLGAQGSPGQVFAWNGGIYFAVSHACAKAAAFLVAGSVMWRLGHDHIKDLAGLARRFPVGTFAFAIAGLSLVGLPPSGGFVGKWLLLKAAMLSGQWWYAVVIIAGSLLAACYVLRVLEMAMRAPQPDENPADELVIPMRMQYSALALALAAVLMGLIASVPLDVLKAGAPDLSGLMERL